MGTITERFQLAGTVLLLSERVKRLSNNRGRSGPPLTSAIGGKPSGPNRGEGLLLDSSLEILLASKGIVERTESVSSEDGGGEITVAGAMAEAKNALKASAIQGGEVIDELLSRIRSWKSALTSAFLDLCNIERSCDLLG